MSKKVTCIEAFYIFAHFQPPTSAVTRETFVCMGIEAAFDVITVMSVSLRGIRGYSTTVTICMPP